jgi:ribosomal protein L11 methyltransferase
MYRWTRLSSQKWEDVWQERLQFLGPGSVVMITWPESRALKIEAFCDKTTASGLVQNFGGRSTRLAHHHWTGDPVRPRAPIPIRGRLFIHPDHSTWHAAADPARHLFIPAGMAFGTGDHATTASCLRLLVDASNQLASGWTAIDAGTGSGILAIAAKKLGAARVEAIDSDPACIRIARENARTNKCRNVSVRRGDARKISAVPRVDVITANLFSELLIASAPAFSKRLKPGGWLIFSGVLRSQKDAVIAALLQCGFAPPRIVNRGKWCAGSTQLRSTEPRGKRHS